MANPYSSQSAVNYNASPPPDDGTKVAANAVTWATFKTKLGDPVLNLANAINTAVQSAFATLFLNTVSPQSANYSVAASDRGKILNISNGATVTLLAPASAGTGWAVVVKNTGTSAVSVAPNGSENIDGTNASVSLNPGDAYSFVSDGTAWWIGPGETMIRWAVAGGSADALTMTNKPPVKGLVDGQLIFLRAAAANATSTPTVAIDGLSAATITKLGGAALVAGDIAGNLHELILKYNLANTRLELLNPANLSSLGGLSVGNLLRSYLAGLTLSTAGGSGTMSIAAGSSMSDDQTTPMATGAFTKTTASWAVGSGNGGLDTGAIAPSTWYHFFQIKRTDTGVTDIIFSLSVAAPTLPANYTKQRRIFSWPTDGSSHWAPIVQQGDLAQWNSSNPLDVNTTNPGTSAVTATLNGGGNAAGGVPAGVNVIAILNVFVQETGGAIATSIYVSDLATPDLSPSGAAAPLTQVTISAQAATNFAAGQVQVRTNTSAQIRYRMVASDANTIVRIYTIGWIDRRGRDN